MDHYWLGLQKGNRRWTDDSIVTYQPFMSEADNVKVFSRDSCAELITDSWTMQYRECTLKNQYICKRKVP